MMKIKEIIGRKKPTFSFEFFPPKTQEAEKTFQNTVEKLQALKPDFVSVTYGAGGATKDKTKELVIKIQKEKNFPTMAHLTGVGTSRNEVFDLLAYYKDHGVANIMALRGDIPKDKKDGVFLDFHFAYELIRFIRNNFQDAFSIGAACYPEKHPEAKSLEEDVEYLKWKVDAGAEFLVTQLFFDNTKFYRFMELLTKKGIVVPVIAGIMPLTNFQQIEKFTQMAQCSLPDDLQKGIEKAKSVEELQMFSVEYSTKQCEDLLKNGVSGIHFYTLNQSAITLEIMQNLQSYRS